LPPLQHGRPLQQPEHVLRSSLRRGSWHILVQWVGMPASEATWEPVDAFHAAHPSFQLKDELFPEGEMLWWASSTSNGTVPVARHDMHGSAQLGMTCMGAPSSRSPRRDQVARSCQQV
jgi:hypothetical protein